MNNSIFLVWLVIIIFSFIRRAARRGAAGKGLPQAGQQARTADPAVPQTKKPIRVSASDDGAQRMPGLFKQNAQDATCETRYGHVHPERDATLMRFGGRPDLEPGYMYLNGVKVLIKEADRLEFLK